MTVILPGTDFSPLQNVANLVRSLVNPNYQRQQALQEAVLRGTVSPEDLQDTPGNVERIYGRGTGKFASGKKSAKKVLADYTGEQIGELMRLPDTDPRKIEFISKVTGIDTPIERKGKELDVQRGEVGLQQQKQALETGKLDFSAKQLQLGTTEEQVKRERDARVLAAQAAMRVGGSDQLYANRQKLSQAELAAIRQTKEYNESFESQRDDFWNQQRIELQRQIENRRDSADNIIKQQTALLARQYADQADRSNPQDIMIVLNDPVLRDKYTAMKELPPNADQTDVRMFEAAQAIKIAKARQVQQDESKIWEDFRRETQGLRTAIRQGKLDDVQKQAAVDEYNSIAARRLGPYFPPDQIPQIAFDKEGPRGKRTFLPNEKTLYFKSGNDAAFGTDLATPKEQTKSPDEKKRDDARIEQAAQLIVEGKADLQKTLLDTTDPETKQKLIQRVNALKAAKGK